MYTWKGGVSQLRMSNDHISGLHLDRATVTATLQEYSKIDWESWIIAGALSSRENCIPKEKGGREFRFTYESRVVASAGA